VHVPELLAQVQFCQAAGVGIVDQALLGFGLNGQEIDGLLYFAKDCDLSFHLALLNEERTHRNFSSQ